MTGPLIFAGALLALLVLGWVLRRRARRTVTVASPMFVAADRGSRFRMEGRSFRVARVLSATTVLVEPDP